jgi:hypothetical protein
MQWKGCANCSGVLGRFLILRSPKFAPGTVNSNIPVCPNYLIVWGGLITCLF